jgi:aryl carrier-like protein
MPGGWLRAMVRYALAALAEQGRLTQAEAVLEMGLSVRRVRKVLRRYRRSGGKLDSLA